MSRENVERWRPFVEGFLADVEEPDRDRLLDKLAELWDPDIEWDARGMGVPDIAGVYTGAEAVRKWWLDWLAAWQTVEFDYDLVDAGDRVVLLLSQRMRGRSTGIEVSIGDYAQVATFRNGLMVRWKVYASQSEALEAVGLAG